MNPSFVRCFVWCRGGRWMQRVVNDDSPIDREDIDGDLKGLREQVRRLEALRERVPEPESTPAS